MVVLLLAAGSAISADALEYPVAAIQRQFVKGHGVKYFEIASFNADGNSSEVFNSDGKGWETSRQSGVMGFDEGKVVANDETFYRRFGDNDQYIYLNGRVYDYSPDDPRLSGKSWLSGKWDVPLTLGTERVRLNDPAVFRAVLATTASKRTGGVYDGVRTILYEGAITFAQLHRADPGMVFGFGGDPTGEHAAWKVSWRLWIGPDQLVRRIWSSWNDPNTEDNPAFAKVVPNITDVYLSGWGMKADIEPPPADQTVLAENVKF